MGGIQTLKYLINTKVFSSIGQMTITEGLTLNH